MNLEVIDQSALAQEWGLASEDSKLPLGGVAALLRRALARWGLSPKRAVLSYARRQLDAVGLSGHAEEVSAVLEALCALGECVKVSVGLEEHIAPCPPRWVQTGAGVAAFLSVSPPPPGVVALDALSPDDLPQRVRIEVESDLTALALGGARRCELSEWLQPLGYIAHARRRGGERVREHELTLASLWGLLTDALERHGALLSEDAVVRALAGTPGAFFGHHYAPKCEGRWTEAPSDGVWCAYRPGHSERHWHPVLVSVSGGERRVLDLYDADEWRWALLARGLATGAPERISQGEGIVTLSFPPPAQLRAALDLLGARVSAWEWAVSAGAPPLAPLIT